MYFTRQVQHIEHYIRTYGAVLLLYDGQNALKLHFTASPISVATSKLIDQRLFTDKRLCPPYQSTSDHLTIQRRNDEMQATAMKTLLAVCITWNAYCDAKKGGTGGDSF